MKKLALILALAPMFQLFAVKGTIRTTAGDEKTGELKWQARQKSYLVAYKKGNTDVSVELAVDDVEKIDVAKPAGFDKAVEMVDNGQASQAIPALSKIVTEYRMLVWDKRAAAKLVQAYNAIGQFSKAESVCDGIIADDRTAAYSGAVAPAYWDTLLKLGRMDQLEKLLQKASGSGDRCSSAAAFIARGDIALAGKDTPDAHRKALVDGYLRVVMLYRDPECAEVRRTAMLKAAASLDKLGKATQAEQMRAQAKAI